MAVYYFVVQQYHRPL